MRGTLVFDKLNDLIYLNCDSKFVLHVKKLAEAQGIVQTSAQDGSKDSLDRNLLVQLFAPLVTSQRFMREQYGNPYTSVQCEDGTNIVFQDFMGFLFLRVGIEDTSFLRRVIGITITIVIYICGPDVSLLKASRSHSDLLDGLLSTWNSLYHSDQSFLIEAVEQMNITTQLGSSIMKSLQLISGKGGVPQVQGLLIGETKLISWFSTRGCHQLGPQDILFLIILANNLWPSAAPPEDKKSKMKLREEKWNERHKAGSSKSTQIQLPKMEDLNNGESFKQYLVLFKSEINFLPHLVHIGKLHEGLFLFLIYPPPTSQLMTSLSYLYQMTSEFHANDREVLRDKQYFEVIEVQTKKLLDLMKKAKNIVLRTEIITRFEKFKEGFYNYLKSKDPLSVQVSPLVEALKEGFRSYFAPKGGNQIPKTIESLWKKIVQDGQGEEFGGFGKIIRSKVLPLIGKGQSPNSVLISKYLEEFPGLVHFIYVERNRHFVIAPPLDNNPNESVKLKKSKIWSMVNFAREHMKEGHFTLMWRDSAFNYAYFLWFEDQSGSSIRAKQASSLPWDGCTIPGLLSGDFYKRLLQERFPGVESTKIRTLELFCIHLGLATSSCVLEHSKRLATTIYEVTGTNCALDLL